MNNLLCSVLLISVILILTDAGCLTYPNITDANFDKDCNGNAVITCYEGFKMIQGLECVEEEWRYQNPICKRTECRYKYSNVKALSPNPYGRRPESDPAKCDETCANDIRCSAATMIWGDNCALYETPFIFVSLDGKEDQCIEKCNEMSECKTFGTRNDSTGLFCYLFNVTLDKIPEKLKQIYTSDFTVAEKICE
ncbi:hypothetical protein LOTGIDRAFT_239619 [Lottia gigantea]|uniref:Apple domain-containing protein n=1 Tax=Lottia gigantea TaxID=225164 RepID=V4BIT3_LOTGI|nr:hypothetical protein LOTGIDRAFT_239619 [Lottia gigantea]ESO88519.1 hypothetical protein LOTGIDRAFT_239619 [Lottia gigantea]